LFVPRLFYICSLFVLYLLHICPPSVPSLFSICSLFGASNPNPHHLLPPSERQKSCHISLLLKSKHYRCSCGEPAPSNRSHNTQPCGVL
jgi:hypothetical protein